MEKNVKTLNKLRFVNFSKFSPILACTTPGGMSNNDNVEDDNAGPKGGRPSLINNKDSQVRGATGVDNN
jgi:hypothetical protein